MIRGGLFIGTLSCALALAALPADAQKLTTLYGFTGGADGVSPSATIAFNAGNIYGTSGGPPAGNVFVVNATTGAESVLYAFQGGNDGASPNSGLIFHNGVLYGTTIMGGANGVGTVFAVNATTGAESLLHAFTGPDGAFPHGTPIYVAGSLYGTTGWGGKFGSGGVFKVNAGTGAEALPLNFAGGLDWDEATAGLLYYGGALYGTTPGGGASGYGVVYKLAPPASGQTTWTATELYNFQGGADGAQPRAQLISQGGALYGTTFLGGTSGYGTVFQIDPTTGAETVLYSFKGSTDGYSPLGALMYEAGNFYGTTYRGGTHDWGTIFQINQQTGTKVVLHDFDLTDGALPAGALIYQGGALYGTTSGGGASTNCGGSGCGTVFKITR